MGLSRVATRALAIAVVIFAMATNALSNNQGDAASYVSVRALDSYGNAVQLSHAREAAQRYGRTVLVAVVEGVGNQTQQILSNSTSEASPSWSSYILVVSLGKTPIFHPIHLPLEEKSSSMLGICFTGVKGDANWLLQQIRKHSANVWERYDTAVMSGPAVAHTVARLLGRFAGHAEEEEWQSSLGLPGKHDEDDSQQSSWSRPLGVQTMIFATGHKQGNNEPGLLMVEPSGRILMPKAKSQSGLVSLASMGKESDKVEARILRLFNRDSSRKISSDEHNGVFSWEDRPPTYEACRDALLQILVEEATSSKTNRLDKGGEILVESYSSEEGHIERKLFRYENGKIL